MYFKTVETHWNQFWEFSFFMILRIFGGSEDLVPVLVSPTGIDTFFCDRKIARSRSSGGVGRCPAACYVGRCTVQVAYATFGDV